MTLTGSGTQGVPPRGALDPPKTTPSGTARVSVFVYNPAHAERIPSEPYNTVFSVCP